MSPRSHLTPAEFAKLKQERPRLAIVPVPVGEQRVRQTFLDMRRRVLKLRYAELPFTAEQFHAWVRAGMPNGVAPCCYCGVMLSTADFIVDHAVPLSRNGDAGLENLSMCCAGCNTEKGEMTAPEFLGLRAWMEDHPEAAKDVRKRLKTGGMGRRLAIAKRGGR